MTATITMMVGGSIGQYRVTGHIGSGGMGVVYAAEHALIGRPAAVKVLLPEYSHNPAIVTRFFNEARAAAAIRHPGIVEIYDFGWHTDGSAYIVMEYLQGESLANFLQTRQTWMRALAITRQIAGALAAAHTLGIVHRDLKPDNVFLVSDPDVPSGKRIKLLDFGIAKLAGEQSSENKTRTGTLIGTPAYMAPEQCRGVAVDHRADLYSLGVILFELCAGRRPFVGEGSGDVLAAHIHVPPPTVASIAPGIPPEIEALVQQLLVKNPMQRLQTAEEVIRLIDVASNGALRTGHELDGRAAAAVPPSRSEPTTLSGAANTKPTPIAGPLRVRRVLIAGLASCALGAVIAVVVGSREKRAAPASEAAQSPATVTPQPATPAPPPAVASAPVATPTATLSPTATPSPTQPSPPAQSPPLPPSPSSSPLLSPVVEPAQINVTIETSPAGAVLELDGKRIGESPFRGTLPRAERDVKLVARRHGYISKVIMVRADASIQQRIKLEPKVRPQTERQGRDQSVNPFGE